MTARRFPPPSSVEDNGNCLIVNDGTPGKEKAAIWRPLSWDSRKGNTRSKCDNIEPAWLGFEKNQKIKELRFGGKVIGSRRSTPNCGEYCQAARAFAKAAIRSVELIVQPDAHDLDEDKWRALENRVLELLTGQPRQLNVRFTSESGRR